MERDTLRRLFGKRLMRSDETLKSLATLGKTQLGFNGQGACELAGTTLQACLESLGSSGNWVCLSVDIVNAFNTIDPLQFSTASAPEPRTWSLGPEVTGPTYPPSLRRQHHPQRAGNATG